MRRAIAYAAALQVLLGFGGDASGADLVRVNFQWDRADRAQSCASRAELEKQVTKRVPVTFVDEAHADVHIQGQIKRSNRTGWNVEFELHDTTGFPLGQRQFTSPGGACSQLTESIVLVLAVAIESAQLVYAEREQEKAREMAKQREERTRLAQAPKANRKTAKARPRDRGSSAESKSAWHTFVGASFAVTERVFPSHGWEFGGLLWLEPPKLWPVQLSVRTLVPQTQHLESRQVHYDAWLAGLGISPELLATKWHVHGCGGASFGRIEGQGEGFALPMKSTGWTAGPAFSVHVARSFGRIRVRLSGESTLAALQNRFSFVEGTKERTAYVQDGVSLSAGVGVLWEL